MEGQSSTALTPRGQQQAKQLALALVPAPPNCPPVDWPTHLYSSSLLRAQQTTQYLAEALQQPRHPFQYIEDCRLREIHQGVFQGLTWTEARAQFPELCAQLMSSLEWQPVPGAESPSEARARSRDWLQHILRNHRPGDNIWAVSHAGIMLHLIAEIMGCDQRTWKIDIAHTATFEFWLSRPAASNVYSNTSKATQAERFNPERWILSRFNQVISNLPNPSTSPVNCASD